MPHTATRHGRPGRSRYLPGGAPAKLWCEEPDTVDPEEPTCGAPLPCWQHPDRHLPAYDRPAHNADGMD